MTIDLAAPDKNKATKKEGCGNGVQHRVEMWKNVGHVNDPLENDASFQKYSAVFKMTATYIPSAATARTTANLILKDRCFLSTTPPSSLHHHQPDSMGCSQGDWGSPITSRLGSRTKFIALLQRSRFNTGRTTPQLSPGSGRSVCD